MYWQPAAGEALSGREVADPLLAGARGGGALERSRVAGALVEDDAAAAGGRRGAGGVGARKAGGRCNAARDPISDLDLRICPVGRVEAAVAQLGGGVALAGRIGGAVAGVVGVLVGRADHRGQLHLADVVELARGDALEDRAAAQPGDDRDRAGQQQGGGARGGGGDQASCAWPRLPTAGASVPLCFTSPCALLFTPLSRGALPLWLPFRHSGRSRRFRRRSHRPRPRRPPQPPPRPREAPRRCSRRRW